MKSHSEDWKPDALKLVKHLKAGGVILSATDTVWGLGCDATNDEAVSKMAALKGRPEEKSFLALVGSDGEMDQLLPGLPDAAWELVEASDRPVTVVGEAASNHRLAPAMVRPDGTLGVRWVQSPYLQFILRGLGRPMASSSANRSGSPTPRLFAEIDPVIANAVVAIGNWGQDLEPGEPSMVVKFDGSGRFQVLRS